MPRRVVVLLGCNILGRDAIPWEGLQSWQEMRQHSLPRGMWYPRESRCPGGMGGCCSSLLRLAGSGHGSVGIPCPWDAGIPVLELEHAGPHTNLKIGQQAMIKPWKICRAPAVGLHPAAFPGLQSHRSCSQQTLPSSAPCSWPLCLFSHRLFCQ